MSATVLVVDDNGGNRRLLRLALEADGFQTVGAPNGKDALQILEEQSIQCVVSDILMPVMDGYRLCFEIRKNPKFQTLPVILFSVTYDLNSKDNAMSFGADRYVNKQTEVTEIASITKEVIAQKRQAHGPITMPSELQVMKEYSQVLIEKLEQRNVELEKQTSELRRLNEEVLRFNRAAVGREQAMIELKRQINALCQELGKKPHYDLSLFDEKKKGA